MALRLENWSIGIGGDDIYLAPELQPKYLHGLVYGHPKFNDGEEINTSSIVRIDKDREMVLTYSGSEYVLGDIDPEYEKQFPDAKNTLFKK